MDAAQRAVAEAYIRQLDASGAFAGPIATTVEPLEAFFLAESYHHDYAELNPGQGYIQMVSMPKVDKLEHYFADRLKDVSKIAGQRRFSIGKSPLTPVFHRHGVDA